MYFTMTGKLSIGKETEKFKPYEEKVFDSGYKRKQLKFNIISGDNIHYLTLTGGILADNNIYIRTKDITKESGETEKGQFKKIPFAKRLDKDVISEVADYTKYILDLEVPKRRYALKKLLEKMNNEGITPSATDLSNVGVASTEELKKAYEDSCRKRYEFVSEVDMIDCLRKILSNSKYKNIKFKVSGKGEYSYYKGKVYSNLIPNRIYRASEDEPESSIANIILFFNSDSLEELEDKAVVDGFMREWDGNLRKNISVPTTITIHKPKDVSDPKEKKYYERIISKFTVNDRKWYEYGVIAEMINGSQKVKITMDMLDDEQKEDIECGLLTLEDIAAEMGKEIYSGEKIVENRFMSPMIGYSKGRKETVFQDEDFILNNREESEDVFEDDDDEI